MPFAAIESMYARLNAERQKEVYDFICFLLARSSSDPVEAGEKQARLERFESLCADSLSWAQNVGMTEADIQAAKKEVRAEHR